MRHMFSLKNVCSNIPVDKRSTTKNTDKSSMNIQSMKYSKYTQPNRHRYHRMIETEIMNLKVISVTANRATITYTYYSKPAYVSIIVTNIQNILDTHSFIMHDSPFTITGLSPNSYYTINTNTVFISGSGYPKTFENAILTLLEGPTLEPIIISNPQYDSAVLYFILPIGDVTSVNLNVLETQNPSQTLFYPNITSPFLITGLQPDVNYDISLSSFYSSTQDSYTIYKTDFFKTFYENYPVFISANNIENTSVTITFSFTANPYSNTLLLTNANNVYDTSFIQINTNNNVVNTFTGLHIDTSYNLKITSFYISTGHIYPKLFTNVFHTLNESPVYGVDILVKLGNLITIRFNPSPGNVLNYVIHLRDINNNVITYTYDIYPESVSFYELTYSMNYTLIIITNYSDNSYTYTHSSYIDTPNEGPVKQMTCNYIENTSVNISFTAAPGAVLNYNIDYQGQRNNVNHYYKTGLTTTSFTLTDLVIYTPYTIIITANYINGHSYKYTYSEFFTTLNQGPSSIFNITIHTNSIDFTLINMYDYPSYINFNATTSNADVTVSISYIGLENAINTYTLTGLSSSTTYIITLETQYTTIENNIPVTRNYYTDLNPITTL